MNEILISSIGNMELLFAQKKFDECIKMVSDLLEKNLNMEDDYKILLLRKRAIVYYKLDMFELMLHDVNVIRQMQSYIDLDDDLFSMEQEAIMNIAIACVIKNLEQTSCESNLSYIKSVVQILNSINPKGIFNKTSKNFVDYAKQTKLLHKLMNNM